MKKAKRIIAFIVLFVVVVLTGYLFFTGKRLAQFPTDYNEIVNTSYVYKDKELLFEEDKIVIAENNMYITFKLVEYKDGVMKVKQSNTDHTFIFIGNDLVYHTDYKTFYRRMIGYE